MNKNCSEESDNKKKSNKIIRSAKLRKYASVYKSYMRKSEQSKIKKSPPHHRSKKEEIDKSESKCRDENEIKKVYKKNNSKKKSLNKYQKFVKDESKKDKYQKLPGKERLSAIATEWKRINNIK